MDKKKLIVYLWLDSKALLHLFDLLDSFRDLAEAYIQMQLLLLEVSPLLCIQLDHLLDEIEVMPENNWKFYMDIFLGEYYSQTTVPL